MVNKLDFPELSQIPLQYQIASEIHQHHFLLDGTLHKFEGEFSECLSPLYIKTDQGYQRFRLGEIPSFSPEDSFKILENSVEAYQKGLGVWQKMSFEQRIRLTTNFIDRIQTKKENIVKYLMWETAKNHLESVLEFDRTIEYARNSISELEKLVDSNRGINIEAGFAAVFGYSPVGTVLCMGPSNYPFYETYSIVIPALLLGNNVILKIPRIGSLFHYFLLDDMKECFPPGTLNLLYGANENTVIPIMETGLIDMLAYFGNSKVAAEIIKAHPEPFRLKLVLGLEAKNPAIVLPDAELNSAVNEVILGALAFNGQRCAALKMVFVHSSIAEEFTRKLLSQINEINFGMPWDVIVRITPLSEPSRIAYLKGLVEDAVQNGAEIINDNGGVTRKSFFYPAVLKNVTPEMRIFNEEQFGPIIPIISFTDPDEIINYATESNYGQQISIFGFDQKQISVLTEGLKNQVSRINLNCKAQRGPDVFPFSGRKNSGLGVLSITETLLSFSERHIITGKDSIQENTEVLQNIVITNGN